ncbi:hypothetical protein H0H92_006228 [Tricholoma furcatifolium]|nr:hypothetical protein H0H92_006228 [Tricholoma furcatifolium]
MLLIIKLWAKPRNLNSPGARLKEPPSFSSYAFTLMTIGFLQARGLLPNLQQNIPPLNPTSDSVFWVLRHKRHVPCDIRYHREIWGWKPQSTPSLREVMQDWFQFWSGEFSPAQSTVSIRHGRILTDSEEPDKDIPARENKCIRVLDPFIADKNVVSNIGRDVLRRFTDGCHAAAVALQQGISFRELVAAPPEPEKKKEIFKKKKRIESNVPDRVLYSTVAGGHPSSSFLPNPYNQFQIMSWAKLGSKKSKDSRENGVISRSVTPIPSRPTTPKPPGGPDQFRSGMLTIRIFSGRGLSLPPGVLIPDVIQKALDSNPPARRSTSNRDSLQRRRNWWLPYVVLEFDKNEILIDAMGGDLSNPVWNYRADFDVSRTSNISVSAYLRTAAAGQDDMGNDLLMGKVDLIPMLEGHHASDQWYNAIAGSGSFHLKIDFKPTRNEPLTIEAFDLLKVIGKGSFGKVMQVRKKDTQRIYALKTIRKAHIAQRPGEITHILAERTVLALVNNPFIVPLKFSFQNPDKLYLVMSFGASAFSAFNGTDSIDETP